MIRNYFKTAFRSLVKQKAQSLLSILSITIGLAVSTLIFLFVQDEFSYDAYHENANRIYRLANNWKGGDTITPWARTSTPMAPALENLFPEIQQVVRIRKNPRADLLTFGDRKFYEEKLYFADPQSLNVFSWKLKAGNPKTALINKNSILLTERIAEKYFGDEDPMGKVLTYDNKYDLKVTGILEEVPSNSHFTFDLLADFRTVEDALGEDRTKNWFWFDIQTYLLISPHSDIKALEAKFPDFIRSNVPERYAEMFDLYLQPLTDIHLTSDLKDELEKNSDEKYSYILLTVALFIMLMACINFMNQSTASFTNRSIEIGVRKAFGAIKRQLVAQYLIEALLLTFIASILGVILVRLILPYFNALTDKGIVLFTSQNLELFGLLLLFTCLVGLISGSYPALYLSNLKPIAAIKGKVRTGKSSKAFRNTLVTLQVTVSLALIISTFVVAGQLNYFQTVNFGFDKEHIIIIPILERDKNDKHQTLTDKLKEHSNILDATFTSSVPGSNNAMSFYYKPVDSDKDAQIVSSFMVDNNFLKTFDLNKLDGLELSIDKKEDTIEYVIVNESFVKFFELSEPVGSHVSSGPTMFKIIGVVEDFNIKSLHHKLEPALLTYGPNWFRYVAVKITGGDIPETLSYVDKTWAEIYPNYPFDYTFLNDNIGKLYADEQKLGSIFKFFTGIAILIAGLGMVSLAAFISSQRTQEIGIRKVLGSSIVGILTLFLKDFLKLIIIAVSMGVPLAYLLMTEWLGTFAYHISLGLKFFIFPVILITMIVLLTVGYHVIKASMLNPVKTLKYE